MREVVDSVIVPLQPFIILNVNDYRKMSDTSMGISNFYEFNVNNTQNNDINAVPDGSIDLLFNIGKNEVHTFLSGTVFGLKEWEMGHEQNCFGIRFQPGKGVLPDKISPDMIVNQDIEIDGNLFGDCLAEKIAMASSFEERVNLFRNAYMKHISAYEIRNEKKNIDNYIIEKMNQTGGNITVSQLEEDTGYSACYIRRIFKEFHGISPKQFAQYIRFQKLLSILKKNNVHFDDAALDCGYYDEPHMMKEFRKYTGITPQNYQELFMEGKL